MQRLRGVVSAQFSEPVDPRERTAGEVMARCLALVEPVLGPGRYNGEGEWCAGEYRFPCPVHGKGDPASDGLRLSIQRHDWLQPRWWCQKCEAAGVHYTDLLAALADEGVPDEALPEVGRRRARRVRATRRTTASRPRRPTRREAVALPTEDEIESWAESLRGMTRERSALRYLVDTRLWSLEQIERRQIGWNWRWGAIAIPVRDADGALANVRLWNRNKPIGERWHWLVGGADNPRLWPLQELASAPKGSRVYLCAGEPDTIAMLSRGQIAVTSLAGESSLLRRDDARRFANKRVVVVYDADAAGRAGAASAVRALREHGGCLSVHVRDLFPDRDDGSDLTVWFREGNGVPMRDPRRRRT